MPSIRYGAKVNWKTLWAGKTLWRATFRNLDEWETVGGRRTAA